MEGLFHVHPGSLDQEDPWMLSLSRAFGFFSFGEGMLGFRV